MMYTTFISQIVMFVNGKVRPNNADGGDAHNNRIFDPYCLLFVCLKDSLADGC